MWEYPVRRPVAITLFTAALATVSLVGAVPATAVPSATVVAATRPAPPSYTNPLKLALPGGGTAASCADPFVLHGKKAGDTHWYIYCTTDALRNSAPKDLHFVPQFRSTDLIHWKYAGDAFASRPSWLKSDAGVWAPDVVYRGGKYYMYYTASDTGTGNGSAIGLAISTGPTGPWKDTGIQVVPPASDKSWRFDPEVISANGKSYIYFGSYFGGIFARQLSADGKHSIASTQKRIAIDNRYEGTFIVKRAGWYYFMGSAANCCNGPLTGYSVFTARSRSPLGPFKDKDGRSILANRVGGTPVLAQNGNKWVGAGHNAVIRDYSGQTWIVYHAVNQYDPYYSAQVGYTKRPALIDPLDWRGGWPVVRGDRGPSASPVPGPAAQPGQRTAYHPSFVAQAKAGSRIGVKSAEFSGTTLSAKWSWIRKPDSSTYSVSGGTFRWQTQNLDLQPASGTPDENDTTLASVLAEKAPKGDYVLDTKVSVSTPNDSSVHNYVQGGLIVYKNAANYVRLTSNSIWNTRQTEFGKHVSPKAGYPAYGNGVVGPVGDWTYLRIVKHTASGHEAYTAYTSLDGHHWDKGITWDHHLGATAKIGLISLGGSGFTAKFAYVHVSRLHH
jgi:arabinan endo-1,5-alpha-L-arabinosidase